MVEVFKTNVAARHEAERLMQKILQYFPGMDVHFDLQDCDKILRVEATRINQEDIVHILGVSGFHCEVLPD